MSQRLFLIFHGRFPSEKAAALFTAKSAGAFDDAGFAVTVLVPCRLGGGVRDPHTYYGLSRSVAVRYLPTLDLSFLFPFKRVGFLVSFVTFSFASFFYLLFRAPKSGIIYSNESLPLWLASLRFRNTFYEVHDFPERKQGFYRSLLRRMRWVLATNTWKGGELARMEPSVKRKLIVEPNAVDIEAFGNGGNKEEARVKLDLPRDKKLAIYTGHLYAWKGVDTLSEAAKVLPEDMRVVFVGGTEKDILRFKESYGGEKRIMIIGHRPHDEMPLWQAAADVLVVPNTGKEAISAHYTSPMKLFEYMASGRPIVASDLPSVREMLSEKNAILVVPDDPQALAEGIVRAFDPSTQILADRAREDIKRHSWTARAERISEFIRGRSVIH